MKIQKFSVSKLKLNPKNPRIIKDEKFLKLVESLKNFPEMLEARPIIVNKQMVVLGGNMRLRAAKEAGLLEVPVIITDFPKKKQDEFVIKDNVGFGEWDWAMLSNGWNNEDLSDWGLDVPKIEEGREKTANIEFSKKVSLSVDGEDFEQIKVLLEMAKKSVNVNPGKILLSGLKEELKQEFF